MPEHLIPLSHATDAAVVGGKARGLATMLGCGLPVPPGFAITTRAFAAVAGGAFARACELVEGIGADDIAADPAGEAARELLTSLSLPAWFRTELTELLAEVSSGGPVAVRSSAVGEDGAATSFAGEHDSFLGVRTPDGLFAAVRGCWASLFSDRAIGYRAVVSAHPQPMGVVVQRLVLAESAGVLMTLNPASGDRSSVVIESVWGLCEPLVSGEVTPDRFGIDRVTASMRFREITAKPTLARFDGTRMTIGAVDADRVDQPSLDDATLARLHSHVGALEACAGGPADAEFAYDGQLWFVQVRPETYWSRSSAPPQGRTVMESILSAITRSTRS